MEIDGNAINIDLCRLGQALPVNYSTLVTVINGLH